MAVCSKTSIRLNCIVSILWEALFQTFFVTFYKYVYNTHICLLYLAVILSCLLSQGITYLMG